MIKILPVLLVLLLCSFPALAQDDAPASSGAAVLSAEDKERLDLSGKMHEIWPIRTRMESALDTVAESFPEDKQDEIKAAMRKSIQFDELEEESIKAMANTFTVDELKAMIAFYGSEAGKSISVKTSDYELAMRPVMVKMIDKAMLDLRTGQQP